MHFGNKGIGSVFSAEAPFTHLGAKLFIERVRQNTMVIYLVVGGCLLWLRIVFRSNVQMRVTCM